MFVDRPELDGGLGEGRRHLALEGPQALRDVRLGQRVGLHMAGHTQTCAEAPQVGPAQLTTDWSCELLTDPFCDRTPRPPIVPRRRSAERRE